MTRASLPSLCRWVTRIRRVWISRYRMMFAMTGAYNVYAVASDNGVRTLTGGLEVVPHYSFEELDRLPGRSADIIAIPFMNMSEMGKYEPIRRWILKDIPAIFCSEIQLKPARRLTRKLHGAVVKGLDSFPLWSRPTAG